MAENMQKPWQAWCKACPDSEPSRIWTGFTEDQAVAPVREHIEQHHGGEGSVGTWRNPGVQWCSASQEG